MNTPVETRRQERLRRSGVGLRNLGFLALFLVPVVGRPPIGQEEAARHRLFMIALIAGGGLAAISGVIMMYLAQPSRSKDVGEPRPPSEGSK